MYAGGGVYTDMDAGAVKPAHQFIPTCHDALPFFIVAGIHSRVVTWLTARLKATTEMSPVSRSRMTMSWLIKLSVEEKKRKVDDRDRELARQKEREREADEQARKLKLLGSAERKAKEVAVRAGNGLTVHFPVMAEL